MSNLTYLPIDRLVTGKCYYVIARNFNQAIWDGSVFHGIRSKFGIPQIDSEYHWDDPEEPEQYCTVKPIRELV